MSIRLNKLLARRGLGARRKCDAIIRSGVVQVNGAVVTEPGTQVEPDRDRVLVRGRPLPAAAALRYYALHKPVGVITTLEDPEGRRSVRDLLPPGARVFPVGRLDADTSGLLVLTNDGELAHRLMHPRYGVAKSYRVRVAAPPDERQLRRLREGVEFEPGVVSGPARASIVDTTPGRSLVALTIHEGRYRQVRRMFEALGIEVLGLHRSAYGPLHLGPLPRGMWRELSEEEVARLRAASARPSERRGRYLGVPGRGRGERPPVSSRDVPPRVRAREVPSPKRAREVPPRERPREVPARERHGEVPARGGRRPRRGEARNAPLRAAREARRPPARFVKPGGGPPARVGKPGRRPSGPFRQPRPGASAGFRGPRRGSSVRFGKPGEGPFARFIKPRRGPSGRFGKPGGRSSRSGQMPRRPANPRAKGRSRRPPGGPGRRPSR